MDSWIIIPLYYLCSVAGLVMVVGGIWLIYKEKIFIDRETKQITEIEIPGGWKFRTNIPVGRIGVMEELKNWEELGSDLDGRIGVRP